MTAGWIGIGKVRAREDGDAVEVVEETPEPSHDPSPASDGPKVVSLDQFRKK